MKAATGLLTPGVAGEASGHSETTPLAGPAPLLVQKQRPSGSTLRPHPAPRARTLPCRQAYHLPAFWDRASNLVQLDLAPEGQPFQYSFPPESPVGLWDQITLRWGMLGTAGCGAASLVSAYQMPVAPPPQL